MGCLGHLSHPGDLLLWIGVRPRKSSFVRRLLTASPKKLLGYFCSICRGRRTEIVNSITPPQWEVIWGKKCKINVFL